MKASTRDRAGEIGEDILIIIITAAQIIFFTFYHKYIAWVVTEPDGSVARLSMLTDGYFTWLPFPIVASILVIAASAVMIVYDGLWFRKAAWASFSVIGFVVVVSLLSIFPFDFSVIPNPTTADVVPKVLTAFLIFMAVFYAISAIVGFVRLKNLAGDHNEG